MNWEKELERPWSPSMFDWTFGDEEPVITDGNLRVHSDDEDHKDRVDREARQIPLMEPDSPEPSVESIPTDWMDPVLDPLPSREWFSPLKALDEYNLRAIAFDSQDYFDSIGNNSSPSFTALSPMKFPTPSSPESVNYSPVPDFQFSDRSATSESVSLPISQESDVQIIEKFSKAREPTRQRPTEKVYCRISLLLKERHQRPRQVLVDITEKTRISRPLRKYLEEFVKPEYLLIHWTEAQKKIIKKIKKKTGHKMPKVLIEKLLYTIRRESRKAKN